MTNSTEIKLMRTNCAEIQEDQEKQLHQDVCYYDTEDESLNPSILIDTTKFDQPPSSSSSCLSAVIIKTHQKNITSNNCKNYCMFLRVRARISTICAVVIFLETSWIVYQLLKNLFNYTRDSQRYAQTFAASFLISGTALLAVCFSISALIAKRPNRFVPYLILNVLSISALISVIFVTIIKSAYGVSHPQLATIASSVAPSFDLLSYSYQPSTDKLGDKKIDDVKDFGEVESTTASITLLIIFASAILIVIKGVFFRIVLACFHNFNDLLEAESAASTAPSLSTLSSVLPR